ncbi:putative ribosomal protein S5 domain 2-type [Helianthus annuus]|nr:putative ribosomal protein S5 domain 2-type [Helianthus annuus]
MVKNVLFLVRRWVVDGSGCLVESDDFRFRHFGGIKLGTGGLVRAYGGVAAECLKNAPTRLIKSQVPMGVEVTFDFGGCLPSDY